MFHALNHSKKLGKKISFYKDIAISVHSLSPYCFNDVREYSIREVIDSASN